MTKEYKVGDYLFTISTQQFFKIVKVNSETREFAYQYENRRGRICNSFWVDFDDLGLKLLYEKNNLLHIKSEQEKLAIQLKYSSAI